METNGSNLSTCFSLSLRVGSFLYKMQHLILYKCPFPKRRVGKSNDGGYVIAELPGTYDLLLAGGVSDDISFETQFLDIHSDLTCYAFDGTVKSLPQQDSRVTFVNKNLASENSETTTNMREYMLDKQNIFMKMDIEGHEFRVLPTFFEDNRIQSIKQLVVEIHSPADIQMFPDYFKGLSDIKNPQMFRLLENINKTHTLVHFHANNGCKMNVIDGIKLPHVFELTYVRNDFVPEKIQNREPLPTPLDMRNKAWDPDYELRGFPYSTNISS